MNRRKIIFWSLASAIISLVSIILTYFGVVRYITLHNKETSSLIENYSKLPKASDNKRVVISLTTTPKRIDKLKAVLNSILDQTVKVDQIAMNLPPSCQNEKCPPIFNAIMNVFNAGLDYGSNTNIIPTLLREGEKDTIIIYLDDEHVYGKDLIETLVTTSEEHPDKAIYTAGDLSDAGGVLVKPEFFDIDVISHDGKIRTKNWVKNHLLVGILKVPYSETLKTPLI